MKDGGKTTKPTEKEDLFMQMVMFMMDNGMMIKLMDLEFIAILMELNTKVIGKKINNMVMDLKHGQTEQDMKANTFKAKNMESADLHGLMEVLSTENSLTIIYKERVNTIGLMEENLMDHGWITKWKEVVFSHGQTAEDMKVNT